MEKIIDPLNDFENIFINNMENNPEDILKMFYQPDYFSLANGFLPWIIIMRNRQLNGIGEYDKEVHRLLKNKIIKGNIEQFDDASLFLGLSGVYYTLCISADDGRYDDVIKSVYPYLESLILLKIKQADENLKNGQVKVDDYDVVNGLSGILKCLIHPKVSPYILNEDIIHKVKKTVENYIITANTDSIKNLPFYLQSEDFLFDTEINKSLINLSHSHGIFGVINSLLDYYYLFPEKQLKDRIISISNYLLKFYNKETKSWLKRIYLNGKNSFEQTNCSWCYGDLSIMYTFNKVSKLTKDNEYLNILNDFLNNIKISSSLYPSPTFCHGKAGVLLQLILLELNEEKNKVYKDLMRDYNENYSYKFRDCEQIDERKYYFDKNNFLTGSLGINLVLDLFEGQEDYVMWSKLVL